MRFFIFICLIINLSVHIATAQTIQPEQIVREIERDYQSLKYHEAEQKAKQALMNYQQFTPEQLVEIHKYLALINYTQKKFTESKKQFKAALSLKPDLRLSPLMVSPKIIKFFNTIKAEMKSEQSQQIEPAIKYVLVNDKRVGASWRSSLIPGWGQLYKGEKRKGTVLISLWTISMGGLLATQLLQNKARDDYLSATDVNEIESRYNTYNTYYKARNSIMIFSLTLWMYAHIDAALKNVSPSPAPVISAKQRLLIPRVERAQLGFTYLVKF